ncbi:class I SAM-dependent methyltransferase [Bdellovibrio sp. HCB337]|uniref:class I SAM-dependent methyltransferase n=1 Tax=Bdellovibrio sp. HCB337 TaxID=3394358 RepID=UPI0039A76255
MDQPTLKAYSDKASTYSQDWLTQPEPTDMYQLLQKYFTSGGTTVDIGCGNGHDAEWLRQQGFKVQGFDSSSELLTIATNLFPKIKFGQALLPALSEIQEQFDNILCETVIMHLPLKQIPEALQNLKRLLKSSGILYLSWRVTEVTDARHNDGRLYSAFEPSYILDQFPKNSILHFEDKTSTSSGKRVCRLIYRAEQSD